MQETQCKETAVDEYRVCGGVDSSRLEQFLSSGNASGALCNFTITEHACSSAARLTPSNVVTVMKCSLGSQRTYPVEVWKLFFQRAASVLDRALLEHSTMAPNKSGPSLSHALEALGEVKIANFSQAQLQNQSFVSKWFQGKLRPFLAAPSRNFLVCLSSRNFSCQTYRIVIQALSSQMASMDRETQRAVFTHFIYPFLARNDSSDPGCVSNISGSREWLQTNFGNFSGFATLQDLQTLNPNFSSADALSLLTPTQVAQLTLSSGALNDTDLIEVVFVRLEQGNALENVDEFLRQLTANGEVPDIQPVVRDLVMNRTFTIISPHFPGFERQDWFAWFRVILIPVLPSFNPVMLKSATSNINCTNYHVVVRGLAEASPATPLRRQRGIAEVLLDFLRRSADVINTPACRQGIRSDEEWIETNLGPFSEHATYSDLTFFNISGVAVLDSLSPNQKAELILDPDSSALDNETIVRDVFSSLTESPDEEQLDQFFETFAGLAMQRNITIIQNPAVRDTILNLTLTALAPEFDDFEPRDFRRWFQVNLVVVMASFRPGSLVVIPSNISCRSYNAIFTGLQQSLESLPPHLSQGVRSSIESLTETFRQYRVCGGVDSSRLEQFLSSGNASGALCNFTITEHACSSAARLTPSNVVTVMKCSLGSQRTYPVEVWKLFFQRAASVLDRALLEHSTMAPNKSGPSLSHALEALGEVKIANFSQAQLQNQSFVSKWFQGKLRPFLAAPSRNFLVCLSSRNFSCQTYRIVIQALSSQMASMDRETQRAVFTHFIYPFLARNDSSDPGCVSNISGSREWLQTNFGNFSGFATLQDLQTLNPNFSSADALSLLTPTQVAQLTLSSGALNDTDLIEVVFVRLEQGNALENVDEFLRQLTANGEVPDIQPVVRDLVMNRTFTIISPHFPGFERQDWFAWFRVILIPVLPSFNPVMLKSATSNINCTNYHVVVRGLAEASPATPLRRQRGIAEVLLDFLRRSADVINTPACRQGIRSDEEWIETNLGPFSEHATYSDLTFFNISGVAVLDSLSPNQKAELILDPDSSALDNETIVRDVFSSLTESPDEEQLDQFFETFAGLAMQRNITIIQNPAVRDTILNLTLTALAPEFDDFEPRDFRRWFQVNLVVVMASFRPGSLVVIPSNISCRSYNAIFTGLQQSLESLPPHLSQGVRSSIESLTETFRQYRVCGGVDSSRLEQFLSSGNASGALCNFTITEHACSSAARLTPSNVVTVMKCSLGSQRTYPVEVWKLFFQRAASVLDRALLEHSTMAPNKSGPSLSHALEALGEVKIANFSQAQLQNQSFVSKWFQGKLRPFLAAPSRNFLVCLSSRNFSCQTYRIVIQALSSQMASMDRETQRAVFTHFIYPFLARNDSSDPGCVSNISGSREWLQTNFGNFSGFATLQDLQTLNPNFSSADALSLLTPTQVAQLTLSSGALNDTDLIEVVFVRLEQGNALENVDEFLRQLTANGEVPDIQPVVRDLVMNRTFTIISPHFPGFERQDWFAWFRVILIPVLPSFNPVMLKSATSNINCTNYHVVVRGLAEASPATPLRRQRGIAEVLLDFLRRSADVINTPACRQGIRSDEEWIETNLGPFSEHATYSDLTFFNISGVAVLDSLSPNQKAELILDPDSSALDNETIVRDVFSSLTESPDEEQLDQFFETFAGLAMQRNITIIQNPAVRDTILNLTLTALAPEFDDFEPRDFRRWFQVNLVVVMASFRPGSLVVIPSNISCRSYNAIFTGLQQSLESLPPHLSQGVRSSIESLTETFRQYRVCGGVDSSRLEQFLSSGNASGALCNFTITEHACSSAARLTPSNVVTVMKCSLGSQRTYPVEVWKLFFQRAASVLDRALLEHSTMAPNKSGPSLSHALEALGEVKIANFSQAQLQNQSFVSKWFQGKLRPFLAAPSRNFLVCLSSRNFSCQTYRIVIQALSSQMASMDRETQRAVFTHFIYPFLARNDSSDPGCVSNISGSREWLQTNFGNFSGFATLQDLQTLNPNFSSADALSLLTPTQVAQLTLSSGSLNDTDLIEVVFVRLEQGNALENVDEFLRQLTANGEVPDIQPVVRDLVMNRTFTIISPHFPGFERQDWFAWFRVILIPVLPSFNPVMLKSATSNINCTNYHVVVRGLAEASPATPLRRQRGIAEVLLDFLRRSADVINTPACRQGIRSDEEWIETNLGPFSEHATYSDLTFFNISGVAVLDSLSPNQKAELILDPDSSALDNETIVRDVFSSLTESPDEEQLDQFFETFAGLAMQVNA
ncbi:uncharacterized protein [Centroberyx affinis]|uniref:uncharacterized protein n=1 Tax=Centroberyx affinis TaxID=166261 RepID=UPI003A5B9BFE